MKTMTLPVLREMPADKRKLMVQTLGIVIGVALLVVSAKIQIPFWPVPLTMQSAVVLLLPCVLGLRAGTASVLAYLCMGAAGYPVFAQTSIIPAGPAYFMGPTGGYLIGFLLSAMAVGAVYQRYAVQLTMLPLIALMLAGHVIIVAAGVLWLAYGVPALGAKAAVMAGLSPFLVGAIVKSALAAMCVRALTTRPSKAS